MPNHLIGQKSPYLLQHVDNPVDWYPWSDEAFEKARQEDKPVLLSIGYATCHWCHVMEHESFSNPAIAEVMNQYLVCIKLDREERPDIDKVYMTAVSALTGAGGWPLNVFLTPDREPFIGGTYFPSESRWGQTAWPDLVKRIGTAWKDPSLRLQMQESGENLAKGVAGYLAESPAPQKVDDGVLITGLQSFAQTFEAGHGGFGPAPKFPMPVNQDFLLRLYALSRHFPELSPLGEDAKRYALHTLRCMARGGIYDHVGGGFARYSTDEFWHIPHFEKMLYDNAQLIVNYVEAFQISGDEGFARVARESLEYLARDLSLPEGGFASAEDADSLPEPSADHKREGAFYVWTKEEIIRLLGPEDGELYARHYGVRPTGNARVDPHGDFENKNILFLAHTLEETAQRVGRTEAEVEARLEAARQKLLTQRGQRPRPSLDDKVITAWNGLALSAMARAARVLGEERWSRRAAQAAEFLQRHLYDPGKKELYRRWRDGERAIAAQADDYAFLIQGLLDLYEATFDERWLAWADELAASLCRLFYDEALGGFFITSASVTDVWVRARETTDNVEPSAASVAVGALWRLAALGFDSSYRDKAEKTLEAHGQTLQTSPRAVPKMLGALCEVLSGPVETVLAGDPASPQARALLAELEKHFLPSKLRVALDAGAARAAWVKRWPHTKDMGPQKGSPALYVCVNRACRAPVTTPEELKKAFQSLS